MTNVSLDRIASALGMIESKTPDTHIWATVSSINDDGSYQVTLNGAGASETTRAARLCNASIGDRVLCVVSNGKVSAIGTVGGGVTSIANGGTGQTTADDALAALGGARIKLLWTNYSPTSSFAAQNIEVEIGYDIVFVICRWSTGDGGFGGSGFGVKGKYGGCCAVMNNKVAREFLYTEGNVYFGTGYYNGTENNIACIPLHVYGIKGVIE